MLKKGILQQELIDKIKAQLSFEPHIEHEENLINAHSCVVMGMGGSMIGGKLFSALRKNGEVAIHNGYGAPNVQERDLDSTLCVAISYSGNTEETLDAFLEAKKRGFHLAVITTGGKLLSLAKEYKVPHIILPSLDLEPRFTLFAQLLALSSLSREWELYDEIRRWSSQSYGAHFIMHQRSLVAMLSKKLPVLYSSADLESLAYIWKATINEGIKSPAFANIFPEQNHNEIEQFSSLSAKEKEKYCAIFFVSDKDNERVKKRIQIVDKLYYKEGIATYIFPVSHLHDAYQPTISHAFFDTLLLGYTAITEVAVKKKLDPYHTPVIQALKKQLLE